MTKMTTKLAAAMLALSATGSALASDPAYATPGTVNAAGYTFEAAATGDIYAYFLGQSASYSEQLGMAAANSTVALGAVGLDNHASTRGDWIDLGHVTAHEIVTFFINVTNTGLTFSSQVSENADASQHIYSTSFAGSGAIPAGTFVSFEDLDTRVSDHDYNDTAFVVTGVVAVPEPGNLALLMAGLGLLGFMARRRRS